MSIKPYAATPASAIGESVAAINKTIAALRQKGYNFTPLKWGEGESPTILSTQNIIDNVIPSIQKKAESFVNVGQPRAGQYVDDTGILYNADGTPAPEQPFKQKSVSEQMKEYDPYNEILEERMRIYNEVSKVADPLTNSMIDSVKAQIAAQVEIQKDINMRLQRATDTALILGGTSRYAISGDDISAAQERAGAAKIAELQAEESRLVAQIKSAAEQNKWRQVSELLASAEKKRQEKQKALEEQAKSSAEALKKLQERQEALRKEEIIVSLFKGGLSDAGSIKAGLESSGINMTLSEIEDVLKIIDPSKNLAGLSPTMKDALFVKNNPALFPEYKGKSLADIQTAIQNANRRPQIIGGTQLGYFEYNPAMGQLTPILGGTSGQQKTALDFDTWLSTYEGQRRLNEEMAKLPLVYTAEERKQRAIETLRKTYTPVSVPKEGVEFSAEKRNKLRAVGLSDSDIDILLSEIGRNPNVPVSALLENALLNGKPLSEAQKAAILNVLAGKSVSPITESRFTPEQHRKIAGVLIAKLGSAEEARKYLERGTLKSGGITYTLTEADKTGISSYLR